MKENRKRGQVYKGVGGIYDVKLVESQQIIKALPRGILIKDGAICIGDYVDIQINETGYSSIEKIHTRKNKLIRPYVSNIDCLLIVVSIIPEPDFILVDKQIISAIEKNIIPIIVLNKSDIDGSDHLFEKIKKQYSKVCDSYLISSVNSCGVDELLSNLKGKTICLSGQSAVGKSSIINSFFNANICDTGELSAKINRGKNTTRHIEIIDIDKYNNKIIDTCGFSSFEISQNMKEDQIKEFYLEFNDFRDNCKYRGCLHINEPSCAVKEALLQNKITNERYDRYVKIYQEIKTWRENNE